MKNIYKKLWGLTAFFALTVAPIAMVVSCGGSSASTLNPKGTLVIARWGNDQEIASQKVAIDGFEKKYNTKVKILQLDYGKRIEQISKWAVSGNLPDIIETDGVDFSNYAKSAIIKPLNAGWIDTGTLKNLIPASLTTMVGKVDDGKFKFLPVPASLDETQFTGKDSKPQLWGIPKEFNTLGVYINKGAFDWTRLHSTDRSVDTYQKYREKWERTPNKTNSKLYELLKHVYTGNGLVGRGGAKKGVMSFTNDPNRFTQLFSDADYEKFKSYNKADILRDKENIKTALKKWWTPLQKQYENVNVEGGALTNFGHKYGWNGEAFDKKSVGAVIEGAWFTPSKKVYTNDANWDIWTAPTPGLFPQGWAITKTSNDDLLAHQFLKSFLLNLFQKLCMTKTGALPVNKNAFVNQYKQATSSADTTFSLALKKKIINHAQGFITGSGSSIAFNANAKARPLLFTSEYPDFQGSWFKEMNKIINVSSPAVNNRKFASAVDAIVEDWVKKLKDRV